MVADLQQDGFGTNAVPESGRVSISVSMPACHAGERGSIPRRGGIKLPPHPKKGGLLFLFLSLPQLAVVSLSFYFGTIFKTIPRPHAAPAGRATNRGSPQSAPPISLSLFLSLRLFIFNRTSTGPVFQKTNKKHLKIFQLKMNSFFKILFQFDLHAYQTYPGDQGL